MKTIIWLAVIAFGIVWSCMIFYMLYWGKQIKNLANKYNGLTNTIIDEIKMVGIEGISCYTCGNIIDKKYAHEVKINEWDSIHQPIWYCQAHKPPYDVIHLQMGEKFYFKTIEKQFVHVDIKGKPIKKSGVGGNV